MCGILGFISNSNSRDKYLNKFDYSLSLLNHRGPDFSNKWISSSNNIAFGHNRLSIRDLTSNSNQPKISNNGRYILTYNGEIYNCNLLIQILSSYNIHISKKNSDTEILLNYLSFFGIEKTLNDIEGMFAFALYDSKKNLLYLARDPFGEKPLYVGYDDSTILFSSEMIGIENLNSNKKELNKRNVELFLKLGFTPAPNTILKDIYKIEPGYYLTISTKSNISDLEIKDTFLNKKNNKKIFYKNYFDKKKVFEDRKVLKDRINNEDVEREIDQSVQSQIISDVPIGSFLSGGIDSSLISILMSKKISNLKTFTLGFAENQFDERTYANKISKIIGSDHNEIVLSSTEMLDNVEDIIDHYSEPFADPSQIPTTLISKFASNSVKVVLTGDGGDELFGGYNRYFYANKYHKYFNLFPKNIRKYLALSILKFSSDIKFQKIANKLLSIDNSDFFYLNFLSLIDPNTEIIQSSNNINDWFSDFKNINLNNYSDKMQYYDSLFYLPDDILHKVDRAAMKYGLETRVPFLSKRVFKLAADLKYNQKYNIGSGKIILKQILEKYLPKDLIYRKKAGFGIPLDQWLRLDLKNWASDLINSDIKNLDFLNNSFYKNLWNDQLKGMNNSLSLWPYLIFINWCKKHGYL